MEKKNASQRKFDRDEEEINIPSMLKVLISKNINPKNEQSPTRRGRKPKQAIIFSPPSVQQLGLMDSDDELSSLNSTDGNEVEIDLKGKLDIKVEQTPL